MTKKAKRAGYRRPQQAKTRAPAAPAAPPVAARPVRARSRQSWAPLLGALMMAIVLLGTVLLLNLS